MQKPITYFINSSPLFTVIIQFNFSSRRQIKLNFSLFLWRREKWNGLIWLAAFIENQRFSNYAAGSKAAIPSTSFHFSFSKRNEKSWWVAAAAKKSNSSIPSIIDFIIIPLSFHEIPSIIEVLSLFDSFNYCYNTFFH